MNNIDDKSENVGILRSGAQCRGGQLGLDGFLTGSQQCHSDSQVLLPSNEANIWAAREVVNVSNVEARRLIRRSSRVQVEGSGCTDHYTLASALRLLQYLLLSSNSVLLLMSL